MQLVIDNAKAGFAKVMHSISCDPYSWQNWHVLHMHIDAQTQPLHADDITRHYLQQQLHGRPGVIYMCDPHNIFIFSRNEGEHALLMIGSDFVDHMQAQHGMQWSCRIYHVATEWHHLPNHQSYHTHRKYMELEHNPAVSALNDIMFSMLDVLASNLETRACRGALKILLVEDDPLSRKIALKHIGDTHHVITAASAKDAVTQYAFHAPDLVLLDIGLPDYPGFHVIDTIKSHDPDAYIIMFSANDFLENLTYCMNAGANGFLGKPLQHVQLEHYIDTCARRRA
jgi:two-component system chemotaxis response regulator CheY